MCNAISVDSFHSVGSTRVVFGQFAGKLISQRAPLTTQESLLMVGYGTSCGRSRRRSFNLPILGPSIEEVLVNVPSNHSSEAYG